MHENEVRKLHLLNIRDKHGTPNKNPSVELFLNFKRNGGNPGLIRSCMYACGSLLGSEP